MSKEIEPRLPRQVVDWLTHPESSNLAIVAATLDEVGFPHFCLLAPDEFFLKQGRLFLSLRARSRSSRFLNQRSFCSLAFISKAGAFYIKTRSRNLGGLTEFIVFEVSIVSVAEDKPPQKESGAGILSGIRFSMPEQSNNLRKRRRSQIGAWLEKSLGGRF